MQIKTQIWLFTFILLTSCGNMTKVDDSKLESFSNITNAGTVTVDKIGVLMRKTSGAGQDSIIYGGNQYAVSMYSSYSALEFISAKPLGYQGNVKFKGDISGGQIVLEAMKTN